MKGKVVSVNSRKFDGEIHRSWNVKFLASTISRLEFVGLFRKEINHVHLGIISPGTISYEFFWLDCWYNIFRFHEPDGSFRNFYCNVTMPPSWKDMVLDYIDLDVDIVVWKDFSYKILDFDEFDANARIYGYPSNLLLKVKTVVNQLISMIENRIFPFNYKF